MQKKEVIHLNEPYLDICQFVGETEADTVSFWCETEEELMIILDAAESCGYTWNSGDDLHYFDGWKDYAAPRGILLHKNTRRVTKTSYQSECNYMTGEIISCELQALNDDDLFKILEV